MIDMEKAKGNKDLVDSCPYGAIWWNEEANIAQKCIFCAHLLDDPTWKPHTTRCAHICPTDAMKTYFVEPAEMEKMIAEEGLEAYLPELGDQADARCTRTSTGSPRTSSRRAYWSMAIALRTRLPRFTPKKGGIACTLSGAGVANCQDTSVLATRLTNCFGDFKFDGLNERRVHARGGRGRQEALHRRDHQGRVSEPGIHQAVGRIGADWTWEGFARQGLLTLSATPDESMAAVGGVNLPLFCRQARCFRLHAGRNLVGTGLGTV